MIAHVRDRRFIDLMAMIAYSHWGGHRLNLERSMPIGERWVPGSACDHLLISLPYPSTDPASNTVHCPRDEAVAAGLPGLACFAPQRAARGFEERGADWTLRSPATSGRASLEAARS